MKEKALFVFAFDKKHQIKSVFPLGLHNLKNKNLQSRDIVDPYTTHENRFKNFRMYAE